MDNSENIIHLESPSGMPAKRSVYGNMLAIVIIAVAITCAYYNSFRGDFIFDDVPNIVNGGYLRDVMDKPEHLLLRMRPVANLTFAVNVALDRKNTWGYHAVNFAIHLLAAWTLFGVVRRTLLTRRLRDRFGNVSTMLACIVATIWAVHPLTTEAVTYIVQRDESLMGLFYLLTIYCVIRAAGDRHAAAWIAMAVLACALGMGTKQVMITAPLVAMVYDRMFLSDSFGGLFRKRWPLYLGLFGTWGVIVVLMVTQPLGPSVGVGTGVAWWQYTATQPGIICKYLQLTFWPTHLCLDYWWPPAVVPDRMRTIWNIVPYSAVIAVMLAAIVWGLYKRSASAFLGVWFFLILAPTSTVLPIADVITERRMYLPLAAIVAGVVLLAYMAIVRLAGKTAYRNSGVLVPVVGLALVAVTVAMLAFLTWQRNTVYYTSEAMWANVLAVRPENPRAITVAGTILMGKGDLDGAEKHFRRSLDMQNIQAFRITMSDTLNNMGNVYFLRGDFDTAMMYYEKAIKQRGEYSDPLINIGLIYFNRKQYDKAIEYYQKALVMQPFQYDIEERLGRTFRQTGRNSEALKHFRRVVEIEPDYAPGHYFVGELLQCEGNNEEAIACFLRSLQYNGNYFEAWEKLGDAYESQNRLQEASDAYARAATLRPDNFDVQMKLGRLYDRQVRLKEAAEVFARAAALRPNDDSAQLCLGVTLGVMGRNAECLDHLRKATELAPKSAFVHYKFGMALAGAKQKSKAAEEFRIALSLDPKNVEIQAALEQIVGRNAVTRPTTTQE